jgi:hypothetical protein
VWLLTSFDDLPSSLLHDRTRDAAWRRADSKHKEHPARGIKRGAGGALGGCLEIYSQRAVPEAGRPVQSNVY